MEDSFSSLVTAFQSALADAQSPEDLERVRVAFLGRKGKFVEATGHLGSLSEARRRAAGISANAAKEQMQELMQEALLRVRKLGASAQLQEEWLDLSLPGEAPKRGHLHIVSQTIAEVEHIFARIGFSRVSVPEIDWDYYAFEALNMPKDHPARDNWETYFLDVPEGPKGKMVATPHPSNDQVRLMERFKPPFRALYIGKSYRRQADVSHVPIHHQFEIEAIDTHASLTELKGVIEFFVREYFGSDRAIRLRPHHFRFTEPSFEIDISCAMCKGVGCRLCKQGWLELAGAGMTHPHVIKAGGLDPHVYKGFAFAFGVERVLMMRSGIRLPDMRDLYKNDLRFLQQF